MKRTILIITGFLLLTGLYGNAKNDQVKDERMTAFVSILPQSYFLERIGGERIKVEVMVTPGKSPSTYEPTPQQVIGLGSADLFFTIGVPFEDTFLPTIKSTLTNLPLIDTSEGIEKRHLQAHHHEGEEEQENEGALDPHVWMSPVLARDISRIMGETLINIDPEGADLYRENLKNLLKDLEDVNKELTEVLAPVKGETLFVYHPAFGYFADQYGLEQEAIELGGKEPSPADLERIIKLADEDRVRIIFVQPEFSRSSAEAVANAINGSVVVAESLNGDYINNLKNLASEIKKGLE